MRFASLVSKALTIVLLAYCSSTYPMFVDEEHCFGGVVPTVPVGRTATAEVSGGDNTFYTVTAWRQRCETDPGAYAAILQFTPKLGQPYVGAVEVYQNGIVYPSKFLTLVRNPRASDNNERYFYTRLQSTTTVIVTQLGSARFDAQARLQFQFLTDGVDGRVELPPEDNAPETYWAYSGLNDVSLSDMWWNPAENGTGLSITKHGSNQMFIVWYTYDAQGAPSWLVWPGGTWSAGTFTGQLYRPQGGTPLARPWDATKFNAGSPVGSASLTLSGPNSIDVTYTLDGVTQTKHFERQTF